MFLIASKYLLPKGYKGMTIFPFVILRDKKDALDSRLINHEKIHIRQQLELLIIPFFVWYCLEFIFRLVQYRSIKVAYRNIVFEREAYAREGDLNYLEVRRFWTFINYYR